MNNSNARNSLKSFLSLHLNCDSHQHNFLLSVLTSMATVFLFHSLSILYKLYLEGYIPYFNFYLLNGINI